MEEKRIQNSNTKPDWRRDIAIGVITSLISTVILNVFPKVTIFVYNSVLDFINNISLTYSDNVFETISFGNKIYPFYTLGLFLLYSLWLLALMLSSRPSSKRKIASTYKTAMFLIIFLFALTMTKYNYINICVKCMNQNIKIVSCYISDKETKALNAEYYQVDSKEDYLVLLEKLEKIANENGAKFYDPFS